MSTSDQQTDASLSPPIGRALTAGDHQWIRRRLRLAVQAINRQLGGHVRRDIIARIIRDFAEDLEG